MPQVPYNTGKVKIGIYYVPPMRNLHTAESDHWQNVFIGEPRRINGWVTFCVMLWLGFGLAVVLR